MQEGGGGRRSDVIMGEGFHLPLLLLAPKVGEGAVSPGTWAPLGAGKNKEKILPLDPPKGTSPAATSLKPSEDPVVGHVTCRAAR